MFGKNLLYGFQFKDDLVATDEIGDVLLRKGLVAEVDCQVLFPLEGDLVLPEGDGERFLVDWLEKSGAEFVEDGKAGAEDLGGESSSRISMVVSFRLGLMLTTDYADGLR